jgi:ABC-2 type transport system ATP-binding protein
MIADDDILIRADGLSRYYGDRCVLDNASLVLRRGEVLGFLGPNGAGKSTTMRILSGVLAPSSGSVSIGGCDLLDEPLAARARLGFLPDQPPLYPEFTVDEYLRHCARLHRVGKGEIPRAVEAAKVRCGLADTGSRLIGNLSKGFQQRVGLAQAIIHLPPLIILDEPTVGLDPIQIREIRALIRELGKDHGVILSTHILPEVQATCDRVQIIHRGELVLNESIDKLERHMKGASLTVAFRAPPPAAELQAIAGVTGVQDEKDGRLLVLHEAEHNPTDEIVRLAGERGWGLYEIRPGRLSLEQLFVEMTAGAPSEGAAASTGAAA